MLQHYPRNFPLVDYAFSIPEVKGRLEALRILSDQLELRSGNCTWQVMRGVESISDVTYLSNTYLGDDFASDIDGFECRGIAFENEAMGIDFAWSIQNILREIGTDWQMIKCLAENPEFAATANAALGHFAGQTNCEGKSIADLIEEEILISCGSGDAGERAANELVESLNGETWIDISGLEENCPYIAKIFAELQESSSNSFCNTFELLNENGNQQIVIGTELQRGGSWSENSGAMAATGTEDDGTITLGINPSVCNGTYMIGGHRPNRTQIVALLLHEGYHAQLNSFAVNGLGAEPGTSFDDALFSHFFPNGPDQPCDESISNGISSQHAILLQNILEELARSLRDYYDVPGTTWQDFAFPAGNALFYGFTRIYGLTEFIPCFEQFYPENAGDPLTRESRWEALTDVRFDFLQSSHGGSPTECVF